MLELRGHRGPVVGLAYSSDGRTLASASVDGTARLWDVRDGRLRETLGSSEARAYCVAFSPDGKLLAVGYGGDHGLVQNWELQPLRRVESWAAHSKITRTIAFGPEGNWIVTGGQKPSLRVWDLPGLHGTTLTWRSSTTAVEFFRGKGARFAALSGDPSTVSIWERVRGRMGSRGSLPVTGNSAFSLSLAKSEKHLALGLENEVVMTSVAYGPFGPAAWPAHDGAVLGVAFLPDGQSLLSAATDGLVKHWSLDGRLIRTIDWRIGELGAVAIAPDGLTAAAGGAEKIVVWDLEP